MGYKYASDAKRRSSLILCSHFVAPTPTQCCSPLEPMPRTMPDLLEDPLGAAGWLVTQLLKDLQTAKVLPIKLVNLKHQEGLRF